MTSDIKEKIKMSEDLNNEVPENMEGEEIDNIVILNDCLLYTSPSPRD